MVMFSAWMLSQVCDSIISKSSYLLIAGKQDGFGTHIFSAANKRSHNRVILLRGCAIEVSEEHIADLHLGRELGALGRVPFAVTLVNLDGTVVVAVAERVVGNIADIARATAPTKAGLEVGLGAGPNFEAGAVSGVAQGDIVDVEILYNVDELGVLAKRANRNAVGAIAHEAFLMLASSHLDE